MGKINCAYVASYYGPYYSNFIASTIAFAEEMQGKGNRVVFVFPEECVKFSWVSMLKKINDRIYFIPYKPHGISNFFLLRKIFKKEKINLVYSHMCGWDFTARLSVPALPVIWHMRMNVNVEDKKKRIKNRIKFKIAGFGKTYHIAASKSVADAINSLHPKHKCEAIPNALDFSRLRPKADILFNECPRLLIFGWTPQVKGLDTALDACEIVNKNGKKVELLVSAQEKTFEYLETRYSGRLPEWLTILEPTDDAASLFEQADIMISASRSEGFSNSLAEAIYSGLPVIYSDIPGTNWADEFKNAYKFKTADAADLAEKIESCLKIPAEKENIVFNRKLMQQKYSMDSWVKNVINFIMEGVK